MMKSEISTAKPIATDGDDGSSLADQAFSKVRGMIVNRMLAGGEVLVEGRLAEMLGLTRTPLREALVRLEGAGLLVKRKNRSFAVRQVGAAEFFQSLKVRKYLESQAARLAVGKVDVNDIRAFRHRIIGLATVEAHVPEHWYLDDDLHNWLAQSGGNDVLANAIHRLRITTQLFEIGRPFDRTRADAEEHLAILQAIDDADAKAAECAVLCHLENIEADVLEIVRAG
ncbi:MAG: GntR family transcriptional regulator [Gammaproteobacteria bacterium]|nr:MAG: GntR family transcriptional regulator [Gammaproteobacteria bacterium]